MRFPCLATIDSDSDSIEVGTDGVWLDITLSVSGEKARARWSLRLQPGGGGGIWTPPPRPGDEVVVVFDGGSPTSAYIVGILASDDTEEGAGDWKLPAEIVSNPDAVYVISSEHFTVRAPTTVVASDAIQLGEGATAKVARRFDSVSVGGLYDAAWVAWRTAMSLAGLPVPPLAVEGKITEGSDVTKSL